MLYPINYRFADFLRTFVRQNVSYEPYYLDSIRSMCNNNRQSVQVSFVDLSVTQPQIAIWLADEPDTILDCFNMVHSYC